MAYNGNLARLSSLCLKNSVILNSDLDAENIMSNLTSCNNKKKKHLMLIYYMYSVELYILNKVVMCTNHKANTKLIISSFHMGCFFIDNTDFP